MDDIYQFTSTSMALGAFTRDRSAQVLPAKYGPWEFVAIIDSYQRFPFGFPRKIVEQEIANRGFQLWRMKPEGAAKAADKKRPTDGSTAA
jgi:hypothetical protein